MADVMDPKVKFEETSYGRKEVVSIEEARWCMLTFTEADGKPKRRLAVTFPNGNLFLVPQSDLTLEIPSKWLVRSFKAKMDSVKQVKENADG